MRSLTDQLARGPVVREDVALMETNRIQSVSCQIKHGEFGHANVVNHSR